MIARQNVLVGRGELAVNRQDIFPSSINATAWKL
jgi:hypothetical protein